MSPLARVLRRGIRVYQYLTASRPSPCRYIPTCSHYGMEAIETHGALRGTWYTAHRLGRCHPWGSSGHDPVPPARSRPAGTESTWRRHAQQVDHAC